MHRTQVTVTPMSRYFSQKYSVLVPYTPGEQPKDRAFVKLNTNESPFPPSPLAIARAREAAAGLQLYSDPTLCPLVEAAMQRYPITQDEILFTNGSDEILNFAFMAFCDREHPAVFPDITYGFYPVFAALGGIPYEEIPLAEDYSIRISDYIGLNKTIFIANPNAPTGILLSLSEIEQIVRGNPDSVVVIDEAYIDFGGESAVSLIHTYDHLLVTQTFSKSRSMAGARLGFGIGCADLIRDLNTVKYSTNPYNVNSMTMAAGIGALEDDAYFRENCQKIIATRTRTIERLRALGFWCTDSSANFIFARHKRVPGDVLYRELRARGVLVRHFSAPRLTDFNRITVGSDAQMDTLIDAITDILAAQT